MDFSHSLKRPLISRLTSHNDVTTLHHLRVEMHFKWVFQQFSAIKLGKRMVNDWCCDFQTLVWVKLQKAPSLYSSLSATNLWAQTETTLMTSPQVILSDLTTPLWSHRRHYTSGWVGLSFICKIDGVSNGVPKCLLWWTTQVSFKSLLNDYHTVWRWMETKESDL